jgi:integrating conjugative element protein (TIGR03759 family)
MKPIPSSQQRCLRRCATGAYLFLLLFLARLDSWAGETGQSGVQNVVPVLTQAHASGGVNTEASRFSQQAWDLNDTEWQRYHALIHGIRGSMSQANLSPLEVLGIHAETEAEQREYARRLAQIVKEDSERVLAFSRIYAEEAKKLNAALPVINTAGLGLSPAPIKTALKLNDRILFFTPLHCQACDSQLATLVNTAGKHLVQLDIYVTDAKSDADIVSWAKRQTLDPASLKAKTITLNHDRGTLARLTGAANSVPKTLVIRGRDLTAVDPASLS